MDKKLLKLVQKLHLRYLFFFALFPMGISAMPLSDVDENSQKEVSLNQQETVITWNERKQDEEITKIQHGIPAYEALNVNYNREGKSIMNIKLTEPIAVGVASKPEAWGYFQFPSIYRATTGQLVVSWNMAKDDVSSYGKGGTDFRLSADDGKTWYKAQYAPAGFGLQLPGGERIAVRTPPSLKVSELQLPGPIASNKESYGGTFSYYRHNDLPDTLRGVYMNKWDKNNTWSLIHSVVEDSKMIRYAVGDLFPLLWSGDMKVSSDNSIIAGIYPAFYENNSGGVDPSGIAFYQSIDQGISWHIKGNIPYIFDSKVDPNGRRRLALGFTEPAFEILSDGTFLCVMRTTDGYGNSPMYISRSIDQGRTWAAPKAVMPCGVKPRLLQLENGVLVLASGRPGLQLRFSLDGKGEEWTDPLEMLPFENINEDVSCGYPRLLAVDADRFLVVYSDFRYPVSPEELRKAIKIREVIVTNKSIPNLEFNGTNQYMTIADHTDFKYTIDNESFSASCWVNLKDVQRSSNIQAIISKRPVGIGKDDGFRLGLFKHGLYVDFSTSNGSNYAHTKEPESSFVYQEWCHVGFVIDASSSPKVAKLYKNGNFIGTVDLPSQTAQNTQDIHIFCGINDGKPTFFSGGKIAALRFWKKALSESEIMADMTASVTEATPDLIAAYDFETRIKQGSEIIVPDITGNHPAKLQNFTDEVITTSIAIGTSKNNQPCLYPNPVKHVLHFDNITNKNISVFSIEGKLMLEQKNAETQLDVSKLPKGIYLVRYEVNQTIYNQRIIKE